MTKIIRAGNRSNDALRNLSIETGINPYAEGSCVVRFGNTHVLCTATIDDRVPPFLRNKGKGWVTAEYGMLPRSTHSRNDRESAKGKQGGRTLEIQRLISRSLRAVTDLVALGERQIIIDCDVLQADGGTRTAAITGGYVALHMAANYMIKNRLISSFPLTDQVAAISCGFYKGEPVLDLDYNEDSNADVDANFVITGKGNLVEIQATGEGNIFSINDFGKMFDLAKSGVTQLIELQKKMLGL